MTPEALRLRAAGPDDAAAVLALWDAAYGSSGRSQVDDIPVLLSHPGPARLLLAELDGRILGTLIATFDGWRGNLYRLAVHPEYQRQGIARRLVEAAHAWLLSLGCRRITALVEGDHDYATSFWESAGYRYDTKMRRYLKNFD